MPADAKASQVIARELEVGESLLWSGQPRQGIAFRQSDVFLIPFSLFWGGFSAFWEAGALSAAARTRGSAYLFPLFGVPFVLIGLYLIFGRFLFDARQRAYTYYGLTNRRILIITGLGGGQMSSLDVFTMIVAVVGLARREVKSLDLATLSDVSITERPDGSGTIMLGPQNPMSNFAGGGWPGAGTAGPQFELIAHVKSVYQQIRDAQRRGRGD